MALLPRIYRDLARRANASDVAIDVFADHTLLFHCRGNLNAHLSDFFDLQTDAAQSTTSPLRLTHTALGIVAALLHDLHRCPCTVLQGADHLLNFAGRLLCALRQTAHFIRHHRKATPLIACARRFNGRVKRQQIGLLGNAANHLQHR